MSNQLFSHLPGPLPPSASGPPSSLPSLLDLVTTIQGHAYAPGTVRNLNTQWKSFFTFCELYHLTPLPATPQSISAYASYLSSTTSSFQSVMNHLNGVRLLHLYQGLPTDTFNSFEVSLTKKGLKRIMGTSTQQKHPITPSILLRIRLCLNTQLPTDAATWALFTVAFFSFLRNSNLTTPSTKSLDPQRQLTREDIKFTTSGAVLRIKWTKTLQHQQGLLLIPLPSIPGSTLCPVAAVLHYFRLVPASPASPMFLLPSTSGCRPITATYFRSSLKRLISHIGLTPKDYSPHSFRRGGATFAFQAGVPEH